MTFAQRRRKVVFQGFAGGPGSSPRQRVKSRGLVVIPPLGRGCGSHHQPHVLAHAELHPPRSISPRRPRPRSSAPRPDGRNHPRSITMAAFNPEKATVKTRHAIAHAQAVARELGHPEVDSLHLLSASLAARGRPGPTAARARGRPRCGDRARADGRAQQATQGQRQRPRSLARASRGARPGRQRGRSAQGQVHQHASIWCSRSVAASRQGWGQGQRLLRELGASRELVLSALQEMRGTQSVTTEDPEGTYEALAKYTRDLTGWPRPASSTR